MNAEEKAKIAKIKMLLADLDTSFDNKDLVQEVKKLNPAFDTFEIMRIKNYVIKHIPENMLSPSILAKIIFIAYMQYIHGLISGRKQNENGTEKQRTRRARIV